MRDIKGVMLSEDWRKKLSIPNVQLALHDRREFAAKVRAARAVLGWSQAELANRIGVTPRTVHRREQAVADVRRSTAVVIENVLRVEGIVFETLTKGGFRMVVVNGHPVADINRSATSRI